MKKAQIELLDMNISPDIRNILMESVADELFQKKKRILNLKI